MNQHESKNKLFQRAWEARAVQIRRVFQLVWGNDSDPQRVMQRLLTWLQFIILTALVGFAVFAAAAKPLQSNLLTLPCSAALCAAVIILGAVVFNQIGHHKLAVVMTVAITAVAPWFVIYCGGAPADPLVFAYVSVSLLLCALLLNAWSVGILLLLHVAGFAALFAFASPLPAIEWPGLFALIGLFAAFGMATGGVLRKSVLHAYPRRQEKTVEPRDESRRDSLTGTWNRAVVEQALQSEMKRAVETGNGLSILVLDVDSFKIINDTYGREIGDAFLGNVGRWLNAQIRASDYVCRYRGDEFLVLLIGISPQVAEKRAQQIVAGFRAAEFRHDSTLFRRQSISCGVASFPQDGLTDAALLAQADSALYEAKRAGKNRAFPARLKRA